MLPTGSILTWHDLRSTFASHFVRGRTHPKNSVYLAMTKQRDDESLQAWVKKFTKTKIEVGHFSDDVILLAANAAMRGDTQFAFSINKKPPRTFSNFLGHAKNYINAEAETSKKSQPSKALKGIPRRGPLNKQEKKRPSLRRQRKRIEAVAMINVTAIKDITVERLCPRSRDGICITS